MPNWSFNRLYEPVFSTTARYIDIWGGRGRGGSHFATDYALFCLMQPQYYRGVLMRASFADIRESLFRDLKDRIADKVERGEVRESDFAIIETSMRITYLPTGNLIYSKGFKRSSSKASAKLKSLAGVTNVIIEETEEVEEDEFLQLDESLRTVKGQVKVIRIFNPPPKNHWLIKGWYNLEDSEYEGYFRAVPKQLDGFLSIFSTYKDNLKNLDATTVKNLLNYERTNPHRYYVVTLGLVSEGRKGRIFSNWKTNTYKDFKELPYPSTYGLDFGFSNDPTALVEIKQHQNKVWIHELIYETGLTDAKLGARLRALGLTQKSVIVADCQEAKSIASFKQGILLHDGSKVFFNMQNAIKGAGSINAGIEIMLNMEIVVTQESTNILEEYQNYSWELDANKEPTDVPEDKNNHAMDATRYNIAFRRFRQKRTIKAGG